VFEIDFAGDAADVVVLDGRDEPVGGADGVEPVDQRPLL
jgi:hypothetical protein